MSRLPDYVERRIVVEFGRQYAYLYMTDGAGKLLPGREESFKQPYVIERKESQEEADETWHIIYDWLNDTINFPGVLDDPDEGSQD